MGVCESIWTPFKVLSTGMSLLNVSEQLVPPLHWDFFKHSVCVSSFLFYCFLNTKCLTVDLQNYVQNYIAI